MKKLILALFVALGLSVSVQAAGVSGGLTHSHHTSSGVVFSRSGTLMRVQLSSASATTGLDQYVQFFDSAAHIPAGGAAYAAFNTTQTVTPPIMFVSSGGVTTLQPGGNGSFIDYGPHGISINNGLYLYFGKPLATTSVTVYWGKEQ